MRLVTLAMAAYGQPRMLDVWFQTIRGYRSETLESLELLIVDDCGSPAVEIPADIQSLLSCQLFRVTEDIPWNQPGARNLALQECRTPLILFVDPDMIFLPSMMQRLLEAGESLAAGDVIRFMLKHKRSGTLDGSSPNTWFLHVKDFDHVGGYDEDYAGHKGWSDVQLLDVMKTTFKVYHRKDLFADFYSTNEVPDAMVTSLDRSHVFNRKIRVRKVEWARRRGGWKEFVRIGGRPRIRFTWERVL